MTEKQLKNTILQEAITGRLVPQDPNDEPASVLLERIREERKRLVKEGKLKKKDLEETPISEEEKTFQAPKGWEWVRWGMLGEYKKGPFGSSLTKAMFVPKSDNTIKVYEQKNAIQKDYSLGEYYISEKKYEEMKSFTIHPGDIIVSCAGTIGETYLLPQEAPKGIINQALMRARIHLNAIIPFWLLYFKYILIIENKLKGAGSAIKNIPPFDVLKNMPIALPPLAEQKRIVAKIEELMPKVEEYGKAQEALDKLNNDLPERLKKSILQEAITGRLVPQDPNDEPASVLLERIREEKKRLVKEGRLKKKDLVETPISEDEKPFDIPGSWEWVRLVDIGIAETGTTPSKSHPEYFGTYIPFLGPANMLNGQIISETQGLSEMGANYGRIVPKGSILQVCIGGSIGKCAIVDKSVTFNQQINSITPLLSVVEFIYYELQSDYFRLAIKEKSTGTATPIINRGNWEQIVIPLPPLAEQKRIVSKVEELMKEIDKLKA